MSKLCELHASVVKISNLNATIYPVLSITKNQNAMDFYESLNKANKYAICYRLQTAKKPETKEKRKLEILEMLKRGEKYHL